MAPLKEDEEGLVLFYQFEPNWQLPSTDPDCIVAQTYMRFVGAQYKVISSNNPHMSPNGALPFIKDEGEVIAGAKNIIEHFAKKNFNLDYHLSAVQNAQKEAAVALVESKLSYATLFNWWMEEDNYHLVTRSLLSQSIPFPLNWILPSRMKTSFQAKLQALGCTDREKVYNESAKCYQALSTLLGDKPFFFGESPTSLDAIAFGQMVIHLYAPMPASEMYLQINQYRNLVRFCSNILGTYFGDEPPPLLFDRTKSTPLVPPMRPASVPPPPPAKKQETPEQIMERRTNYLSVIGAISVMGVYIGAQNNFWRSKKKDAYDAYNHDDDDDDDDE